MEGQTISVYRVPAADGAPAVTLNLNRIESIQYSGQGNEQRCTVHLASGLTHNFNRQNGQLIETAWQQWAGHQNAMLTGQQAQAGGAH